MGYRLEDVCFLEKLKNELGPNYENEFGFLFILVDPSDPHYKEEKIVVYGPESKKYVEQERFTHLHCGRPDSAPPKKIKGRRIKKIRW